MRVRRTGRASSVLRPRRARSAAESGSGARAVRAVRRGTAARIAAGPLPPPRPALAQTRPREITVVRYLLGVAMAFCLFGNVMAVAQFIRDPDPMMLGFAVGLALFAFQAAVSPGPLGRGARWAWTYTFVSSVLGLTGGIPAVVMGLMGFASQSWLLPFGLVWTGLYCTAITLLSTPEVRAWIFGRTLGR
ncbi:hypothetical protein GCM10029992_40200 [Glycomyces albus]